MDAVTGASSYTGRYIARELLARGRSIRSLARHHDAGLFAAPVEWRQLEFSRPHELAEALTGIDTLYNTYWIRFPRDGQRFESAVQNTRVLIDAARQAGVRRVVHISVSNADPSSPFPYFRGKAATEEIVRESGLPYAIVRPTLVYGVEDILIHNMAWLLRHAPIYMIPGDGRYRTRPVYVGDVAGIAVDAAAGTTNLVTDAAGPEVFTYEELVQAIRTAVRSRSGLVHVPPFIALAAAWSLKPLVRDVIVTSEELNGLMNEVVMSDEPPKGTTRFLDWLHEHAEELGRKYASELKRHWVRPAP
jgi:NADH dehydrogenase